MKLPATVNDLFRQGYVLLKGPVICTGHGCSARIYRYRGPDGKVLGVDIDSQANVSLHADVCVATLRFTKTRIKEKHPLD